MVERWPGDAGRTLTPQRVRGKARSSSTMPHHSLIVRDIHEKAEMPCLDINFPWQPATLKKGVDHSMSHRNILILCGSLLLFMLGALLIPGLLSATVYAMPLDPPRICPPMIANGDADGSQNGPVHTLQKDLNKWYSDSGKDYRLKVDGIFGPKTERAVKEFQGQHKDRNGAQLAQDGIVGTLTWGALGECHS